jgi:predicted dehydrogenase
MHRRDFVNIMSLAPLSVVAPRAIASLTAEKPVRIGIDGLSHSHVHLLLSRKQMGDIEIAGIAEPDRDLAERYAKQYGYNMNIVYDSIEEMITKAKPEAVAAFNSIFDHLRTVEHCAPKGIHVMVEKPLAVSVDHANKMQALARKHNIQLLTNYETTWYGTHARAWKYIVEEKKLGEVTKFVFHTGHEGPMEIGVNKEFLAWLTDPVLNGGGALIDFGCYGSNLATWFMQGEKPVSVRCLTQQLKPAIYPKVDDECTIIVEYPKAQAIIQASWNWPFGIKDTRVYGRKGYIFCNDRNNLSFQYEKQEKEMKEYVEENTSPYNDPFSYLVAVLRKKVKPAPYDLSSLENNMMVVNILESARESAKTGMVIKL